MNGYDVSASVREVRRECVNGNGNEWLNASANENDRLHARSRCVGYGYRLVKNGNENYGNVLLRVSESVRPALHLLVRVDE